MESKCILVGVSGGIAAYKSCELVSRLKKAGHDVHVLMTAAAEKFVGPLTFQTLSGNRVVTDLFSLDESPEVHHIALAKKADVFVIAPATANVIAKVANGIADDMLTSTFLAATCPKLVVPAMNTHMLENPATQANLETLRARGMHILESASGYLACGDTGRGKLPEPEVLVDRVEESAEQLAKAEREGAWRTMARQIAHEINNPLTPMKLSVQKLQLKRGTDGFDEYFDKTTKMLIAEIDNLAHIAQSFSTFAKQPEVVTTEVDVAQKLSNVITLQRANDEQIPIRYVGPDSGVIVRADNEQITQVFVNIIRNAIQAVTGEGLPVTGDFLSLLNFLAGAHR